MADQKDGGIQEDEQGVSLDNDTPSILTVNESDQADHLPLALDVCHKVSAVKDTPSSTKNGALSQDNVTAYQFSPATLRFQDRLNRQTALISQMQHELKESQKRITDMESAEFSVSSNALALGGMITATDSTVPDAAFVDDTILHRLEEEQTRNSTLNNDNFSLQLQLDELKTVNANLVHDCLQLAHEFDKSKNETQLRTLEYSKMEQLYLERLSLEHNQLLQLWRSFQQLRRDYMDFRSLMTRSLCWMDSEMRRVLKGSTAACHKLAVRMVCDITAQFANVPGSSDVLPDGANVEEIISGNVERLMNGLQDRDRIIRELNKRVDELSEERHHTESQLLEKHEQERNAIERRLNETSQRLASTGDELKALAGERDASVEAAVNAERRLKDAEERSSALQNVLIQNQEVESDLKRQLESATSEKRQADSRIVELMENLRGLETQKKDLENANYHLDGEINATKQRLSELMDNVCKKEEIIQLAAMERESIEGALSTMENENTHLHHEMTQMRFQLEKVKGSQRKRLEESHQHSTQLEMEITKLRMERDSLRKYSLLHRTDEQRTKNLEEENKRLRERIDNYDRLSQQFVTSAFRNSLDIVQLRAERGNTVRKLETSISDMPSSRIGSPVQSSTPRKREKRGHRRRGYSSSQSSASGSLGISDEQCGLDCSELASPDGLSFRTAPLVLYNDSSPSRTVLPIGAYSNGNNAEAPVHRDLGLPRLRPSEALLQYSNRKSRFSRNLVDVLNDPCELGYFMMFMDSRGFKHLIKFWLETETFRVTAARLDTAENGKDEEGPSSNSISHDSSQTAAEPSALKRMTEQDAVSIFAEYISKEAAQNIGATDELRDNVINRICDVDGRLDPNCFSAAQQFLLDIMERRFFGEYLDSVMHCKYVLDLLNSGPVFITDILYNDVALFHFAEFMEQEGQRNLIEFWLSVDSFQHQLAACNVNSDQADQAQKDAMVLYDKYFSMQATSPVGFDDELRMEIENNICREDGLGPSADCFDKPFRYVLKVMEQKWLPPFMQSSSYNRYLSELVSAARCYDLDLPHVTGKKHRTSTAVSTVSSGGSSADGECSRRVKNSLLAQESATAIARKRQAETMAKANCNRMVIEMTECGPSTLWTNDKERPGFGYVDHVGRYVREYTHPSQHQRAKSGGEKISEAVRKFVQKDTKEQEALAEEVAALIVQDVTNMVSCGGDIVGGTTSATGSSDGLR